VPGETQQNVSAIGEVGKISMKMIKISSLEKKEHLE